MSSLPFIGARLAYINLINTDGTYNIIFADDPSNIVKSVCAISVGSFGSGIICGYHIGSPVLCIQTYQFEPKIIGYADQVSDIERSNILDSTEINRPKAGPGEIKLQSSYGANIGLDLHGDISLTNINNDGLFISKEHHSITSTTFQKYDYSESGITIEGRAKRLSNTSNIANAITDLLKDVETDHFHDDICRDSTKNISYLTRDRGSYQVVRNPAFSEKRELIFEFADSFLPRDPITESKYTCGEDSTILNNIPQRRGHADGEDNFSDLRHSSRTNLLTLDYNTILERVQGTLIDVYGNILDLNYNIINMPEINGKNKEDITAAYDALNRSIAYHFQINTRNSPATGAGKFILDVDKEGQFKLNVPRSTYNGNVPVVSKFSQSESSNVDLDIKYLSKSNVVSPLGGSMGTPFHDMTNMASRAIQNKISSINTIIEHAQTTTIITGGSVPNIEYYGNSPPKHTNTITVSSGDPAISSKYTNEIIGGRSGLLNFEGSLEMSLGGDDADNKSLVLDTYGSILASIGSDKHGRSMIIDTDGEIVLSVGGNISSNGQTIFNPGAISIRVNIVDDNNKSMGDHLISLSKHGIVVSAGNGAPIVFRTAGDMMLEAGGKLDFKASSITVDSGVAREFTPRASQS